MQESGLFCLQAAMRRQAFTKLAFMRIRLCGWDSLFRFGLEAFDAAPVLPSDLCMRTESSNRQRIDCTENERRCQKASTEQHKHRKPVGRTESRLKLDCFRLLYGRTFIVVFGHVISDSISVS